MTPRTSLQLVQQGTPEGDEAQRETEVSPTSHRELRLLLGGAELDDAHVAARESVGRWRINERPGVEAAEVARIEAALLANIIQSLKQGRYESRPVLLLNPDDYVRWQENASMTQQDTLDAKLGVLKLFGFDQLTNRIQLSADTFIKLLESDPRKDISTLDALIDTICSLVYEDEVETPRLVVLPTKTQLLKRISRGREIEYPAGATFSEKLIAVYLANVDEMR